MEFLKEFRDLSNSMRISRDISKDQPKYTENENIKTRNSSQLQYSCDTPRSEKEKVVTPVDVMSNSKCRSILSLMDEYIQQQNEEDQNSKKRKIVQVINKAPPVPGYLASTKCYDKKKRLGKRGKKKIRSFLKKKNLRRIRTTPIKKLRISHRTNKKFLRLMKRNTSQPELWEIRKLNSENTIKKPQMLRRQKSFPPKKIGFLKHTKNSLQKVYDSRKRI